MAILYRLQTSSENTFTLYLNESFVDDVVEHVRCLSEFMQKQLLGALGHSNIEQAYFLDVIPANNNVTVEYNPLLIGYKQVQEKIWQLLEEFEALDKKVIATGRANSHLEIPIYYGPEVALDIEEVARQLSKSIEQVVELHQQSSYQVAAVGFAPGFAYLNGLHPSLRVPRKSNPRKLVPAGSLAIAEGQSAIYPCDSPGGWHIIGHCPVPMFEAKQGSGAKLKFGDTVNFKSIEFDEYQALRIHHSTRD